MNVFSKEFFPVLFPPSIRSRLRSLGLFRLIQNLLHLLVTPMIPQNEIFPDIAPEPIRLPFLNDSVKPLLNPIFHLVQLKGFDKKNQKLPSSSSWRHFNRSLGCHDDDGISGLPPWFCAALHSVIPGSHNPEERCQGFPSWIGPTFFPVRQSWLEPDASRRPQENLSE